MSRAKAERSRSREVARSPEKAAAPRQIPILMSGPMARAILDGRKTQTRRVVKRGQVFRFCAGGDLSKDEKRRINAGAFQWVPGYAGHPTMDELLTCCPYGVPGDVLWVREGLRYTDSGRWIYRADDSLVLIEDGDQTAAAVWDHHKDSDFCASIHMPYWACRLFLRVKSVRVERLSEISAPDIVAEGRAINADGTIRAYDPEKREVMGPEFRAYWEASWNHLNGERGYGTAANPWVWVIEFERCEKPGSAPAVQGDAPPAPPAEKVRTANPGFHPGQGPFALDEGSQTVDTDGGAAS